MDRKEKGSLCESLVSSYLESKGHRIMIRNYRCPMGELDIVSVKDGVLCVTEVKSLTAGWDGDEIRHMVTATKLNRMRKALSHYLSSSGTAERFDSIRFDVASVTDGRIEYYCGDE